MRGSEMDEQQVSKQVAAHYKICILGCSGIGKTKLITRYKTNAYSDTGQITLIDHIPMKKTLNRKQYIFDYYDTAGQERYRATVGMYLRDAHACILVYDLTIQNTLDTLPQFEKLVDETSPEAIKIVIGNKLDLGATVNQGLLDKFTEKGIKCHKASAKTGENVESIFDELEKAIVSSGKQSPTKQKLKPVSLNEKNKTKTCC